MFGPRGCHPGATRYTFCDFMPMEELLMAWRIYGFCLFLLLAPVGWTGVATAHTEAEAVAEAGIVVDEQLGAKLPLDLVFRDEAGLPVTLAALVSGPTLILPVYYSCTNVCNFLQAGLARTLPDVRLAPVKDYRVLSISFDETETPELAAKYQRTYLSGMSAPFPYQGWRFLTGDSENIRRFTSAIGYHFRRDGRDFIHPVASVVIAGDGTIVRYLYGTGFLSKDVTLALIEAREGRVGLSIKRLVEYCFRYDPQQRTYVFNLLRVSATVVIVLAGGFLVFLLVSGRRKRKTEAGRHE